MKLPNGDRAVVPIHKLRDYCLNPAHPRGRNKARVFAAALGLRQDDAQTLRQRILQAAREGDARPLEPIVHGERFALDFPMTGPRGAAMVRSLWIVLVGEDFPRLYSCYVLR